MRRCTRGGRPGQAVDEVAGADDVGGAAGCRKRDQRGGLLRGGKPAGGEPADPGDDRLAGGFGVGAGRLATVAATTCLPSRMPVDARPGETALTRMPRGRIPGTASW